MTLALLCSKALEEGENKHNDDEDDNGNFIKEKFVATF